VDWSLFGCARKGHLTYAPDEPGLRDRLMATTAGGTAWRCLRCGAFVTGGPGGGGPAAAAPLVRRGTELRGELILRVFAVERFLRFLVLGAAAYAVWRFTYDRAGLQRMFNHALPAIRALYQDLGFNFSHSKLIPFIQHSFVHTSRWLTLVAIALAAYALLELAESAGLWLARRWGEYLAMVATSVFLPLEVWELVAVKVTWLKVTALVINLLLVIYLVWTRRLFGVRGGKAAYDARLRSESVIEVEQAALAGPGKPIQNPKMPGGAMEGLAPILHVASARASIEWYAALGFETESEHVFGPGWPLYVRLRRGPARLHLSEHRLDGGPRTHAYLYVEDVDRSIPAGAAAEDCPWGMREARLTDPDGNEVRIGSPIREKTPKPAS
jgi:uncharacterized membrane protein (DUF2068 family)/catechol 2,3-dioxygenase-like lactoylglutathione lyase family enzyme